MKLMQILVASLGLVLTAMACQGDNRARRDFSLVLYHVQVIPMDQNRILEDQTVLVEEGRITAMGPRDSVAIPDGILEIDGKGRYLIPGLSDLHAHGSRKKGHRPQDYLAQGVTVVRNMQGEPHHLAFREKVNSGKKIGPRFFTAGPAIAGEPRIGKDHVIPKSAPAARELVREFHQEGYDYIKVYSLLRREFYDAILDEASRLGIPVVGHVPDSVRASHALESGLSSIEHFFGYFWELEAEDSELEGRWSPRRLFHAVPTDPSKFEVLAKKTAEAGVWNCPTLWRKNNFLTSPMARESWNDPQLRALGESNRNELLLALHRAGAGLLTGTDDQASIIHQELELFVEAGLSPYEALRASTSAAADFLGALEEFGTVEVGKEANLVLLAGNPLEDIRQTAAIVGVVMRGSWIPVNLER